MKVGNPQNEPPSIPARLMEPDAREGHNPLSSPPTGATLGSTCCGRLPEDGGGRLGGTGYTKQRLDIAR